MVVQMLAGDEPAFLEVLGRHGLGAAALYLGAPVSELRVQIRVGAVEFDEAWADLQARLVRDLVAHAPPAR